MQINGSQGSSLVQRRFPGCGPFPASGEHSSSHVVRVQARAPPTARVLGARSAVTRPAVYLPKPGATGPYGDEVFIYAGSPHTKPPCCAHAQHKAHVAAAETAGDFALIRCLFFATDQQSHSEGRRAWPHDHTAQPAVWLGWLPSSRDVVLWDSWERMCAAFPGFLPVHRRAARGLGTRPAPRPRAEAAGVPADFLQPPPRASSPASSPLSPASSPLSHARGPIFHPTHVVTSESAAA